MAGSQSSTAQEILWRLIPARKPSRLSMPQRLPLSRAARNWGRLRQAKGLPIPPSGRKLQPALRAWPPIPPLSRAARNRGRLRQAKGLPIPHSRRKSQPVFQAWPPIPPHSLQGSLCQARANYLGTPRLRRPNRSSRGKSGMQPPIEETLGTPPLRAQGRCLVIGMTDRLELVGPPPAFKLPSRANKARL